MVDSRIKVSVLHSNDPVLVKTSTTMNRCKVEMQHNSEAEDLQDKLTPAVLVAPSVADAAAVEVAVASAAATPSEEAVVAAALAPLAVVETTVPLAVVEAAEVDSALADEEMLVALIHMEGLPII